MILFRVHGTGSPQNKHISIQYISLGGGGRGFLLDCVDIGQGGSSAVLQPGHVEGGWALGIWRLVKSGCKRARPSSGTI